MERKQVISLLMNGRLKLATVSGVLTTRPGIITAVDENLPAVDVITTKSYQVNPNHGNPEPVIVEVSAGNFGNSVGLRNPGMKQGIRELREMRNKHDFRALLNVSISGSTPDEFQQLAEVFSEVADILELNLSCPHAAPGYGMSIGTDPALVAEYVAAVRKLTDRPIFPKLTPNVENIGEIALAAVQAGADGICAINTVGPELYIEPYSGKPVLMNQRGNRGGKSGTWIADTARKKISEIRSAVGPNVPIIGIGGVSSGEDVKRLSLAGANVVGIGSVFARVKPENWRRFTDSLVEDALHNTNRAVQYVSDERLMEYRPFSVKRIESGGHGTVVVELNGEMDFKSSQFAFLWIPEIGEKPFSIAHESPLTFFIKDRGPVSGAICDLKAGDTVFVRGVYGHSAPLTNKDHAYILAGGTGIAVAHKLVKELAAHGTQCTIYYATSHKHNILVPPGLDDTAVLNLIPDEGLPARAIYSWRDEIERTGALEKGDEKPWALYTIGPPDYMRRAVEIAEQHGARPEDIYLSVETATHCGIGLCGECECGGKLTCQEGTFFTKEFFDKKGIEIADLPSHHASISKIGVSNHAI